MIGQRNIRNRDRLVRVSSWARLALVLVATSAGLLSRRVEACSPVVAGLNSRAVWPAGDKAVPTSVQLLVSYGWSDWGPADLGADLVVLDAAGQSVPVASTREGTTILLEPTALLPGQTYRLADRRHLPCTALAADCGPTNPLVEFATFTTAGGPDTVPPTFAGLASASAGARNACHGGGCCGDREEVPISLAWSGASDDVAGTDLRYNVYRQEGATLVPVERLQRDEAPFTGFQTCEGDVLGRQLPPGAYVVRAVDYAGNEDKNRVTRTVQDECFTDCWFCGCAVANPPPHESRPFGPIAAVAIAALLMATRRRASRNR